MALLERVQQRLWDLMPMIATGRAISYEVSYKYVRGWRNSASGSNVHGSQYQNVWLEK